MSLAILRLRSLVVFSVACVSVPSLTVLMVVLLIVLVGRDNLFGVVDWLARGRVAVIVVSVFILMLTVFGACVGCSRFVRS